MKHALNVKRMFYSHLSFFIINMFEWAIKNFVENHQRVPVIKVLFDLLSDATFYQFQINIICSILNFKLNFLLQCEIFIAFRPIAMISSDWDHIFLCKISFYVEVFGRFVIQMAKHHPQSFGTAWIFILCRLSFLEESYGVLMKNN